MRQTSPSHDNGRQQLSRGQKKLIMILLIALVIVLVIVIAQSCTVVALSTKMEKLEQYDTEAPQQPEPEQGGERHEQSRTPIMIIPEQALADQTSNPGHKEEARGDEPTSVATSPKRTTVKGNPVREIYPSNAYHDEIEMVTSENQDMPPTDTLENVEDPTTFEKDPLNLAIHLDIQTAYDDSDNQR